MKKLVFVACLLGGTAHADDSYICTVTSTGTSVNSSSVAACTSGTLKVGGFANLSVQCDAPTYVKAVESSTATVTSSNGTKIDTDVLYDIPTREAQKYLAFISVSGTANCKVFHVVKR